VDGTLLQTIGGVEGRISGELFIAGGTASVAGRKLARGGGGNPYHKAIEFLSERGFRSGDLLTIAGARTKHQGKTVFVVHAARAAVKKKNPRSTG